ncbi:MAG: bifunctional 3,4-dihydroxy-2-butanone-4-phosphate synthase/GTP cyclohydrolase II, partial [Proteobacteria bacterium]|nr:bifunctional 3,4-dihydroxy-2-butanone-4-phosphate synthase/GTP cyclohydrolase II [Pseudomonadota bacterium]
NEKTIERVTSCDWPTEFGNFELFAYKDSIDNVVHFALVKGKIESDKPPLIRVHISNTLCDLTNSTRETCGLPLRNAIKRVAEEETGIVVILNQKEDSQVLIQRIEHCCRRDKGEDLPANPPTHDLRTHGLGAQILSDLGVHKMRVLSAPKKMHALSGFGLEVIDYVNDERKNDHSN